MDSHYEFATFQPDRHTHRKNPGKVPAAGKSGMSPSAKALKAGKGPQDFPHTVNARKLPGSGTPQENRDLVTRLSQAEQGERQRIAQILHDDLQQLLCSIHIKLCLQYESIQLEQKEMNARIRSDITRAITMTRKLSSELVPPGLENTGLLAMLGWLGRHMQNQFGLAVTVVCPHDYRIDSEEMRILVYQGVRELLFNVVKHADTRSATVTLKIHKDRLCIQVTDPGKSLDVEKFKTLLARPKSHGLVRIREQLILHGGGLQITSVKGKGTKVLMSIPKRSEETIAA